MGPTGEQRPCYDVIWLEKFMLKFKGVIPVEFAE